MKIQCAVLLVTLGVAMEAQAGAIVTATTAPFASIDAGTAKRIFLGREFEMDGQPLAVVYQGEGATRSDFENKVLGRTGAELTAYWSKQIFTGRAAAPLEEGSDSGVKALVSRKPGAIGYISDAGVDDSVKVLLRY